MAVKQTRVDDLDGKSEGAETVVFISDGVFYEIDLVDANTKKLSDALAPFAAKAREVSSKDAMKQLAGNGDGRELDTKAIREWAASQGIECPAKGRVPGDVVTKYLEAHPPADSN